MSKAAAIADAVEATEQTNQSLLLAPLAAACVGEFIGTFVLILVGDGAVAAAVFAGAIDGWGVAVMWGLAVTFAIYVASPISEAHFNPAVTLTMALFRGFPAKRILPYIASQIAGAYAAAACVYWLWHGFWQPTAEKLGVTIGGPGSQKLMAVFSCFYPNPGVGVDAAAMSRVSTSGALFVEVVLTAFLLLMILALSEPDKPGLPEAGLGPVFVGLTVTVIVGLGGSLTMDAVNPVRDFGPRLFAYTAGFGGIAFPGPRGNEWWLYIVAPLVGGPLGAAVYEYLVRRFWSATRP